MQREPDVPMPELPLSAALLIATAGCAAPAAPASPPIARAVTPEADTIAHLPMADAAPDAVPPELPVSFGGATLTLRQIALANGIDFVNDGPDVRPESIPLLDDVVALLVTHPDVHIDIGCHTDNRGTSDYSVRLTQQRADTLRSYLVGRGVSPERLTAKGYGATRPIADGPRAAQRRCELRRADTAR